MPSLHLDIPSIDWIGRPSRADHGGGKAAPLEDERAPAPGRGRAQPPGTGDTRDLDPWPGSPAGVPA